MNRWLNAALNSVTAASVATVFYFSCNQPNPSTQSPLPDTVVNESVEFGVPTLKYSWGDSTSVRVSDLGEQAFFSFSKESPDNSELRAVITNAPLGSELYLYADSMFQAENNPDMFPTGINPESIDVILDGLYSPPQVRDDKPPTFNL